MVDLADPDRVDQPVFTKRSERDRRLVQAASFNHHEPGGQPGAPATRAEPAISSVHTLTPHPLPPHTDGVGLASVAAARPEASRPEPQRVPVAQPAPYAATPPARVHATPRPYARSLTCCWPIGEPGTKTFRFCDDGAVAGKPYCTAHAALAYVKVRDRREDAA